jgi:serine protease Do/serine protease DegQ
VGINTAIIGPAGGNVGIGFAVPSNMARAVMNQIVRYGEVRRGRLGIEMVDLTPEIAKKLGVNTLEGAAITGVQLGSPAEKAGLRERDVIVGLNGRTVRTASELRARLGLTPVGEEVELKILRGGETRTLRARIAAPQEVSDGEGVAVAQLPGMKVIEIERGSPLYQRLRGGGLVVTAVEPGSRAFQAGFRPGDIIYAVNRRRVQTLADFQNALRGATRGFAVSLLRGDFNLTIVVG